MTVQESLKNYNYQFFMKGAAHDENYLCSGWVCVC